MEEIALGLLILKYAKKGFKKFVKFVKFLNGDYDDIINSEMSDSEDLKAHIHVQGENAYNAKEIHVDHQTIYKINGNILFVNNYDHCGYENDQYVDLCDTFLQLEGLGQCA